MSKARGILGSSVMPEYTQRKGIHYATSETDLMHIAKFTSASSTLYSVGGFFVGVFVNIFLSYGGANDKLTPLADFWLHRGCYAIAVASLACFAFGYGFTRGKNAVLDQIRIECGVKPKKTVIGMIHGWIMRRFESLFEGDLRSPESTTHD